MAGGAAVSVITKSGTNSFHGVAFEYTPTTSGARRTCSSIPTRRPGRHTAAHRQPVRRHLRRAASSRTSCSSLLRGKPRPQRSAAMACSAFRRRRSAAGNFAGLATIYDPATGNLADGTGRTPFPGNIVPEARWSPAARTLQGLIPLPNTGTGQTATTSRSSPYYFKRNLVDGKMNWTPSHKVNVFGKYSVMISPVSAQRSPGRGAGRLSGWRGRRCRHRNRPQPHGRVRRRCQLRHLANVLLDANFGGTRMHHNTEGPDYGKNIGLDVLKIPGTNGSDVAAERLPDFQYQRLHFARQHEQLEPGGAKRPACTLTPRI